MAGSLSRRDEHRTQMKSIAQYISAPERPEAELANINDRQIEGSCIWLTGSSTFQDWQSGYHGDSLEETPKCFWLSGKPGTGKSVAAGHVIKYLESCNADCSYYFFRHNNREGSGVAAMLRSLAYQMADTNASTRLEFLAMVNDAEYFNKDDAKSVWRTLFSTRILRVELRQPHYWIIDGLDECSNHAALFQLLSKVDKLVPLRIFVTSRPLPSIERLFSQEKIPVFAEQVAIEKLLDDIRLFLQANVGFLPVEEGTARDHLIDQIIQKSNGSFLWAALVLKELEDTHSEQQIKEVLSQVPSEMDDLYHRILEGIEAVPKNRSLAKAIFGWAVCAARPLSVDELREALILDTGHVIPRLETVVSTICGYLVDVSGNCRVQVVHETVKSFLTRPGLESECAVEKRKEHSRIAEVCLKYLCGEELQASRSRRSSATTKPAKKSPLADYASVYFSEHLAESSSAIDAPLVLLDKFFKTNVLAWIEMTARKGSTANLLQTSRNLKAYLHRRAKYRSPLGKEVQAVQAWTDDLIRLVASFGRNLLSSPESIHFLTPPLCPPKSMIYRNFKDYTRSLEVVGLSDEDWDDRISCMVYPDGEASSVACRESRFAVGLSTGKIVIYRTATFEESRTIDHGEPVRHLCFAGSEDILASCGRKLLALWDPQTGSQLWKADITGSIMSVSFDHDDSSVLLATRDNSIASFRTRDGERLEDAVFFDMREDGQDTVYRRPPTHACFCPELNLLGVAYRQRPISFWDLEDNSWLSHFHKGSSDEYPGPLLVGFTINPNPNLELAAASYQDGDLVVFNPFDGKQLAVVETSAQVLVPSPNGKTLATGDGNGMIQLFNFETLRLLYRITTYDFDIRTIAFTSDSLRFFDIRGNHCNAWEPTVLVRKGDPDDSNSEPYSDEVAPSALLLDAKSWTDDLTITSMCEHHVGKTLFCGRENGSVAVFDVRTGKQAQQLVSHTMVSVNVLEWNTTRELLASADVSSRVVVRPVTLDTAGRWRVGGEIIDMRAERSVRQLLLDPTGTLLLVSTDQSDDVWRMNGTLVGSRPHTGTTAWRWINHPVSAQHLLLVAGGCAHIFAWASFMPVSRPNGIMLGLDEGTNTGEAEIVSSRSGRSLCIHLPRPPGSSLPELQTYLAASIRAAAEAVEPVAAYSALAGRIKTIVGVYRSSVLFLDLDGWLCSVNMDSCVPEARYSRHFFIPFSWHNVGDLLFSVTAAGSVALAHKDEIVVFHNGLDFFEQPIWFAKPQATGAGETDSDAGAETMGGRKVSRRARPGARAIRSDPGPL